MIQTVDVSEIHHVVESEWSSTTLENYPKHSTPIKDKQRASEMKESKKKRGLFNSSSRGPNSPPRTKTHGSPQNHSLSRSSGDSNSPTSPTRTKTLHGSSAYGSYLQDQSSSRVPISPTRTKGNGSYILNQSIPLLTSAHDASKSRQILESLTPHSYYTSVISTPVKNKSDATHFTLQSFSPGQSSLESSTIQKQRDEIQLLMNEIKERDKELNETVSAHQHQLTSWQADRTKIIVLEQKCRKYKRDLITRRDLLDEATSKLENLEKSCSIQLESNKARLTQLIQDKDSQTSILISLEGRNKNLNDSLKEVSSTVGEMAAREQEMVTLLKLKGHELEDLKEKYNDLYTNYTKLEKRNVDCHTRERDAFGQSTHWQEKYNHALCEVEKLKVDIEERDNVLTQQIAQINEAQQHMIALQEALIVSDEREKTKDELIKSLKSKEGRRMNELRSTRELYERQQRELTMIQMNLDTSQMIEHTVHLNTTQHNLSSIDPNIPELDTSYNSKLVSQKKNLSFDDRLSRFLDINTTGNSESNNNNNNNSIDESPLNGDQNQEEPDSPGGKLQRLLTESKQLIETLERSSLPSTPAQQSLEENDDTSH